VCAPLATSFILGQADDPSGSDAEEIVPEIPFNGRNLLTPEVMKDEFLPLYGGLYVELWAVQSAVDHPRLYTDETLEAVEPDDNGEHEE
jgi:hypothetical protein